MTKPLVLFPSGPESAIVFPKKVNRVYDLQPKTSVKGTAGNIDKLNEIFYFN